MRLLISPHKKFWMLFFGIQFILFLPAYIFYFDHNTIYPSTTLPPGDYLNNLVYLRNNFDPFRLSIEISLLLNLLFFTWRYKKLYKSLFAITTIVYLLTFFYYIYFAFYTSVYNDQPYFQNDYTLIKEVVPVFLGGIGLGSSLNMLLGIIGLILVVVLLIYLIHLLFKFYRQVLYKRYTLIGFLFVDAFIILVVFLYHNKPIEPLWPAVQTVVPRFYKSMHLKDADRIKKMTGWEKYESYMYYDLEERPNIYLIFMESYGNVIQHSEPTKTFFDSIATINNDKLTQAGWHITSNYAKPPIIGGRSWLSFTTAKTGTLIENQIQYNDLINTQENYPHLIQYLNQQGYETFRMKSMKTSKNVDSLIPYEQMNSFWKFDQWVTYDDMPYQGIEYDRFGLPDQYSMGYFHDNVLKGTAEPYFLFFITMTSHGPWYPVPPVTERWQDLDTIQTCPLPVCKKLEGKLIDRYAESIAYEWQVFSDYMLERAPDNSLFIIIGDHQPPLLDWYNKFDKWLTPFHVISKDSTFVKSFEEDGFNPGILVKSTKENAIRNEAIYSLFMRKLVQSYGGGNSKLPTILDKGI